MKRGIILITIFLIFNLIYFSFASSDYNPYGNLKYDPTTRTYYNERGELFKPDPNNINNLIPIGKAAYDPSQGRLIQSQENLKGYSPETWVQYKEKVDEILQTPEEDYSAYYQDYDYPESWEQSQEDYVSSTGVIYHPDTGYYEKNGIFYNYNPDPTKKVIGKEIQKNYEKNYYYRYSSPVSPYQKYNPSLYKTEIPREGGGILRGIVSFFKKIILGKNGEGEGVRVSSVSVRVPESQVVPDYITYGEEYYPREYQREYPQRIRYETTVYRPKVLPNYPGPDIQSSYDFLKKTFFRPEVTRVLPEKIEYKQPGRLGEIASTAYTTESLYFLGIKVPFTTKPKVTKIYVKRPELLTSSGLVEEMAHAALIGTNNVGKWKKIWEKYKNDPYLTPKQKATRDLVLSNFNPLLVYGVYSGRKDKSDALATESFGFVVSGLYNNYISVTPEGNSYVIDKRLNRNLYDFPPYIKNFMKRIINPGYL